MKTLPIYLITILLFPSFVFAHALIISSLDAGVTWNVEQSYTPFKLNDVAVSITTGIAITVGDNGTILRRDEEGNWIDVSPDGLSKDLYSVAVGISSMMACGEDGVILSSFDGGNNWRVLSDSDHENIDLYSVNFDPTHANSFLIAGENGFLFSSESGIIQVPDNSDFVTSSVKLCSGFPEVVFSRNGTIYYPSSGEIISIPDITINGSTSVVSGGGKFITVGDNGVIFRYSTENLWESIPSTTFANLNDVTYITWGVSACAVGDNGTVLFSGDNGLSWEQINLGTTRNLNAVGGNGAGEIYIVGNTVMSDLKETFNFFEMSSDEH